MCSSLCPATCRPPCPPATLQLSLSAHAGQQDRAQAQGPYPNHQRSPVLAGISTQPVLCRLQIPESSSANPGRKYTGNRRCAGCRYDSMVWSLRQVIMRQPCTVCNPEPTWALLRGHQGSVVSGSGHPGTPSCFALLGPLWTCLPLCLCSSASETGFGLAPYCSST